MADWTLSAIMDAVAAFAVAQGITTTAYAYPVANPTPPCLIVGYPSNIKFNFTFHGPSTAGAAQLTFPLWYVVARVLDLSARDALSAVITGLNGMKVKMDAMTGSGVSYADLSEMKIESVNIGGVDYLVAAFELDVVAV